MSRQQHLENDDLHAWEAGEWLTGLPLAREARARLRDADTAAARLAELPLIAEAKAHLRQARQWADRARHVTTLAGVITCAMYAGDHLDAAVELAKKGAT